MSQRWSCATLGEGAAQVTGDFLETASPEELDVYAAQIAAELEDPYLKVFVGSAVVFHSVPKPLKKRHCRRAWDLQKLAHRWGGYKSGGRVILLLLKFQKLVCLVRQDLHLQTLPALSSEDTVPASVWFRDCSFL